MEILFLIVVFAVVMGLVLGLGMWWGRPDLIRQRVRELAQENATTPAPGTDTHEWRAKVRRMAAPMAWLSTPEEGWETSSFRIRFMQAGLRGAAWPVIFFGSKTFLALLLPSLLLLFGGVLQDSPSARATLLATLSIALLGYYSPNLGLKFMISRRQRELQDALPDAIDLITVCVEAGLGLDAAMNRAGEELSLRSQALADELKLVALERRVGSTRASALTSFALRTGVDDIATFVTLLIQTEHLGTNVADSLRILSDTMRVRRTQRAEETAAKIPLKLLFPLIFFMFPSLFLVLLGPAVINVSRTLLPTLGAVG